MLRKLTLTLSVAIVAVGVGVAAAASGSHLDPSFGEGGVARVSPAGGCEYRSVQGMAADRAGASFVLFRQYCLNHLGPLTLYRYDETGAQDTTFGGGSGHFDVFNGDHEVKADVVVDSNGQPVIIETGEWQIVLRRLTAAGAPDPTFGANGMVSLDCRCDSGGAVFAAGRNGQLFAVLPRVQYPAVPSGRAPDTTYSVIRLKRDGSRDERFGHKGVVTFSSKGRYAGISTALSKQGALYVSGGSCCGPSFLDRISVKGRLDTRFDAASARELQRIEIHNAFSKTIEAIVVRTDGKIDLLGSTAARSGFVLRLKPDGHALRGFGKRGMRLLRYPVTAAALGSDGATLAVSDEPEGTHRLLLRILPGGRLDPEFGPEGEPISGSEGGGMQVVAQAGRKALVLDPGRNFCRYSCNPDTALIRFTEGPPQR